MTLTSGAILAVADAEPAARRNKLGHVDDCAV
jgi:hypothetical protein